MCHYISLRGLTRTLDGSPAPYTTLHLQHIRTFWLRLKSCTDISISNCQLQFGSINSEKRFHHFVFSFIATVEIAPEYHTDFISNVMLWGFLMYLRSMIFQFGTPFYQINTPLHAHSTRWTEAQTSIFSKNPPKAQHAAFPKGSSEGSAYPFCSVSTEQPRMMSLLHHNVGYSRLVILLQTDAGFSNGQQFIIQNLQAQEQRNLGSLSTAFYTQHLLTQCS